MMTKSLKRLQCLPRDTRRDGPSDAQSAPSALSMTPFRFAKKPACGDAAGSVVTAPVAIAIRRTRLLLVSATSAKVPSIEMDTSLGSWNEADMAVPSANDPEPEPASVVTTPVAIATRRTR